DQQSAGFESQYRRAVVGDSFRVGQDTGAVPLPAVEVDHGAHPDRTDRDSSGGSVRGQPRTRGLAKEEGDGTVRGRGDARKAVLGGCGRSDTIIGQTLLGQGRIGLYGEGPRGRREEELGGGRSWQDLGQVVDGREQVVADQAADLDRVVRIEGDPGG